MTQEQRRKKKGREREQYRAEHVLACVTAERPLSQAR